MATAARDRRSSARSLRPISLACSANQLGAIVAAAELLLELDLGDQLGAIAAAAEIAGVLLLELDLGDQLGAIAIGEGLRKEQLAEIWRRKLIQLIERAREIITAEKC